MQDDEIYIRAMFGEKAVHLPLNFILQNPDESTLVGVVQCRLNPQTLKRLVKGSQKTHQLILGDAIIRPRIIAESNHLRGVGLAGIMTSSDGWDMQAWAEKGKLLFQT